LCFITFYTRSPTALLN